MLLSLLEHEGSLGMLLPLHAATRAVYAGGSLCSALDLEFAGCVAESL